MRHFEADVVDVPTPGVIADDAGGIGGWFSMRRVDGMPCRVLVVAQEQLLVDRMSAALRRELCLVTTATSGGVAVEIANDVSPDVVVLDVELPDMSGKDVVYELRKRNRTLPLLLLTPKPSPGQRVAGLTAGGNDYLTKPFSLEEMIVRLRTCLGRGGVVVYGAGGLVVGDLVLNEDGREVARGGDVIELSATEYELLRFLMRHSGRVLTKAQILDRVWRYDFVGRGNVVELYVSYLRKKVESGRTPMIHTLRGVGYVLKPGVPMKSGLLER